MNLQVFRVITTLTMLIMLLTVAVSVLVIIATSNHNDNTNKADKRRFHEFDNDDQIDIMSNARHNVYMDYYE